MRCRDCQKLSLTVNRLFLVFSRSELSTHIECNSHNTMSQDSKKNQDEKKKDPKDRRKSRNPRKLTGKMEQATEIMHKSSALKAQKLPVKEKPVLEQNKTMKVEPEEVIKTAEEDNSKYKKKEIQSNWSKYEMPIESYEEVEEHDTGADYEKLIQAPLSIGGHFQFKHEKSWDVNTGPSLYDKYFNINRNNLSFAVSTIPFYERNDMDQTLYSEHDMLTMNNRATKYKEKYYDDKSFATPETEAQDRILNNLKEGLSNKPKDSENIEMKSIKKEKDQDIGDRSVAEDDVKLLKTDSVSSLGNKQVGERGKENASAGIKQSIDCSMNMADVEAALKNIEKHTELDIFQEIEEPNDNIGIKHPELPKVENATKSTETPSKSNDNPVGIKYPVIESPEDLEKWLDDLLDG